MPFFVHQKVQILSKILAQIPNFANLVKFHQKSIFSSGWPVFVILSVFRQKRNPLEPSYWCTVAKRLYPAELCLDRT